jgi:hypothetical protein
MIYFKDLFKKLFRRAPEDIDTPISIVTKNSCFICKEDEPPVKSCYLEVKDGYGYLYAVFYHKECVEQLICNSDKLPAEMFGDLIQAIQIVQQWKKDEIRDKKNEAEFRRQLEDSKQFLCNKENK